MNGMNMFRGVGMYTMFLRDALETQKHVTLTKSTPDIIHYPYFDLFFHTLPARRSAPTVVTIHDVIPLVFPRNYPPGIKGKLRFFLQLMSLQTVDAIVTDSNCSKQDICSYLRIPEKKVHVTHLAGNPDITRQPKSVVENIRKEYTLPESYILYVGDMNYNKNLVRFLRACATLPEDVHVVLVGRSLGNIDIPEGKELHEAASSLGDRVHILTNVPKSPHPDLAALFTGARAYVQPSLYEGFGLSVLDAMQCSCPVVCSNVSSLPEVAGDAALYMDPWDIEDMTRVIKRSLSMKKTRQRYPGKEDERTGEKI